MFPRYLLTDFRQTFVTGASRDRNELIRFWGQKVKVQGHGMTECIPDFHVSTISPVTIDRFSPNFSHWCILGHRWPDYVFGSKGQSSRSHHRGGGAQHSTLLSSATFSCLVLFGSGPYWFFGFFYLNEQMGSLVVDLAYQLSFFRFASTLGYLIICTFITFWSLEAVNI